jgi:tetratricopeptide (TPR) repeat protein
MMGGKPIFDKTPGNQLSDQPSGQPDNQSPNQQGAADLIRQGQAFYERGEWQPALDCLEQALAVCRADPRTDRRLEATTLNLLGGLYYYRAGRQRETAGCYRRALEISRESGDRAGEAKALFNLAGIYQAEGRYPEAKELLDRLVALDRALASPDLRSHLIVLGAVRKRLKRLGLVESNHHWGEEN